MRSQKQRNRTPRPFKDNRSERGWTGSQGGGGFIPGGKPPPARPKKSSGDPSPPPVDTPRP